MFPGAGIIIYPARNSTAILVGALFFFNAFPSFVDGVLSPNLPVSSGVMASSSGSAQYQHRIAAVPHYGPSQDHHHHRPSSSSPHNSDHNSPVEDPSHSQDAFRYVLSRDGNLATYQGSSSAEATWSNVKAEEENGYTTYPPTHEDPPYA